VLLSGGGLVPGRVIGQTDVRGERSTGNHICYQNIVATLYHVLGINPATTIPDHQGRPQYLLE
jgi:hypothetical protein